MMIYLHHYFLSLRDCQALRLKDTYSLHRAVYNLFPDVRGGKMESSGILFVNKGSREGRRHILILSCREALTPEYGQLQTHTLEESFLEFPCYRFEIVLNPVRKNAVSGKREPVRGREAVAAWFMDKAPSWGFQPDAVSLQVVDITVDSFPKGEKPVTLSKARITGALAVTDRNRFLHSFKHGIGHGKAFGCGLLQIAPILPNHER